jgi:hypothetical protein
MDRCNLETPSGPAYAQVDRNRGGDDTLVASLARFSLVDVPGSSFDVVTTHPMNGEEHDHAGPIDSFIRGVTGPGWRTTSPYWPVIVVGDFNMLIDEQWPTQTTKVFWIPHDEMAVAVGSGVGLQPAHGLSLESGMALPSQGLSGLPEEDWHAHCTGPQAAAAFSDHCGLLVRFSSQ